MYIYNDSQSISDAEIMARAAASSRLSTRSGIGSGLTDAVRVKWLARIAAFYHRAFMDHPTGQNYLCKLRGIRNVELCKTFQIGLANGTLKDVLPRDEEATEQLKSIGVLTCDGHEYFAGCIVFPLWDASGAVINLVGRCLADPEGDYLFLPGERRGLWNS